MNLNWNPIWTGTYHFDLRRNPSTFNLMQCDIFYFVHLFNSPAIPRHQRPVRLSKQAYIISSALQIEMLFRNIIAWTRFCNHILLSDRSSVRVATCHEIRCTTCWVGGERYFFFFLMQIISFISFGATRRCRWNRWYDIALKWVAIISSAGQPIRKIAV